jgi:hypothetical protein
MEVEERAVPAAPVTTPAPARRGICVGMATYDDFDGVWFTIQAIRMFHEEVLADLSFLVVDNHPEGVVAPALRSLGDWVRRFRYVPFDGFRGTAVRDLVFREADADVVCCFDSHVLLVPGALARLREFFDANPDSRDLLQGPLLYDDLEAAGATHLKPTWGAGMYGQWERDPRIDDPGCAPFEIPMQGLGVFACRKDAWPGLNPRLRGFGCEEGYLHEKFRRQGGRVLCHPGLAWAHRFVRPGGMTYPNDWQDRARNYFIAWSEIGWDVAPVEEHYRELLGSELDADALLQRARAHAEHPLNVFDAIFCVAIDGGDCGAHGHPEAIAWRVERLRADAGVTGEHRRLALWREAIVQADRRGYEHVLLVEDASELADAAPPNGIDEQDWHLCVLPSIDGGGSGAPGVAIHRRAFEQLLADIPRAEADRAGFIATWSELSRYLARSVARGVFTLVGPAFEEAATARPAAAAGIEVVELADGLIVRQSAPARVHQLNNTAAVVLELCDGHRSVAEIADVVAELFGLAQAPLAEVSACVAGLRRAGVLLIARSG